MGFDRVEFLIDGRRIDMIPFVQSILKGTVLGVVGELDGYREGAEGRIEFRQICRSDLFQNRIRYFCVMVFWSSGLRVRNKPWKKRKTCSDSIKPAYLFPGF